LIVNPYLDVDKKILSEIYSGDEPMKNLEVLCDIHGSRFPGTPGDLGSVHFMVEKLKEYGLENTHSESYKIPGWKRGKATLTVTSPIIREFDVISLPHSISGEVEATLVDLGAGHLDIYEIRKEEIEGNIVMVSSARPMGMNRSLHRSEKFRRSVLSGAKGWIFMNHYPAYGPPTGGINPLIPSIGISYEDGTFIQRLLAREGKVKVRIKTTDKNLPVETYNVVAEIPGIGNDREYVISGSHYDGHDISQGAYDPASGVAVVMEMARVLQINREKLKRKARFILFGAEETGLHGSRYYVQTHQNELKDCRFMLNLDSAGGPGKKGIIFTGYPELFQEAVRWAKEMKTEIPYLSRISGASDHWPFFQQGVPTANGGDPTRTSIGRGYGHTKYDTVDKLNLKDLRNASANYSRILFRAANTDNWPVKRKSKQEINALVAASRPGGGPDTAQLLREYVASWTDMHPDTKEWLDGTNV